MFFAGAVDMDATDLAHLADGLNLRACLLAAAVDADCGCVGASHVLGGDPAGGARADLPEIVALDEGEQGAGLAVVQADEKAGTFATCRISFIAHDAEGLGGR